jgi:hypothetical protein
MNRVSDIWQETLKERYEDYYLAIWIFSPRQTKTQLVAAIGERIEYYRNLFKIKDADASFPQAIQHLKNNKQWKPYWDYEPYWKDEDELDDKDHEILKKKSAYKEEARGMTYYLIPQGTVWVKYYLTRRRRQRAQALASKLSVRT